jgi:hypothetical protein
MKLSTKGIVRRMQRVSRILDSVYPQVTILYNFSFRTVYSKLLVWGGSMMLMSW